MPCLRRLVRSVPEIGSTGIIKIWILKISPDIQINLDPELQQRLIQEAARRGQDAQTFTDDLLRKALDNLTSGHIFSHGGTQTAPRRPGTRPVLPSTQEETTSPRQSLRYRTGEDREEWARWEAAGRAATEAARATLKAHGASRIYERDGVVWEELPDGTTRPFDVSAAEERLAR